MTASDHLSGDQFPVYELGTWDQTHAPNPGYVITPHDQNEAVHPSHYGFSVEPRKRPEGQKHFKYTNPQEVDLPLNQVKLSQDYVYRQHVENLASVPGKAFHKTQEFDPVSAERTPGGFTVTEGHHRTVAARVRGDKTVRATLEGEWRHSK